MTNNYSPWSERNGFSNWALAIAWIIIAFLGFQVVATIVFFTILFITNPGSVGSTGIGMLTENFDLLFIGNSTGQILFLALATWFFCRLQVRKEDRTTFLRFQANKQTLLYTGIALLSVICIQPFIWFLGWINSLLPTPELFKSLQAGQLSMLQKYITGNQSLTVLIFFHVSLVPAICEEILFRGYVLRSFQKSWGYIAAIIVSGLIFGLFHLRLTHLLPLAAIGILLGYLTWVSESIIPAMAAHFFNNAGSVFLIRFFPNSKMASPNTTTLPPIWLIIISIAITGYFLYFLYNRRLQSIPR